MAVNGSPGTVRRTRASTDSDEWQVDAPSGGFLRVSGTWDEGWRAAVDGHGVPVRRADGIFRGVVVPAGQHTVRFAYSSPDAERGLRLAAAASLVVVVLFGLSAASRVRSRRSDA
jgi:uncharacterized membrane protein YfhO